MSEDKKEKKQEKKESVKSGKDLVLKNKESKSKKKVEKKIEKIEKKEKKDTKKDKDISKKDTNKNDINKDKDIDSEEVDSEELDILKVKKDKDSGMEELPEDIKKKLEKRKAELSRKEKGKKGKTIKKKKKIIKKVSVGNAYIKVSYNNTIVTLTDLSGNVLSWASAGIAGFKGPKKSTPYAAQIITRIAVGKAREEYGLSEVSVFIRGIGTGRESAVRSLNNNGLIVTSIKDITPMPHNGCRKRKPRRV